MNIKLPNNGFGTTLMLLAILLVITIPFVITLWLVGLVAPLWVSIPVAFAASFIAFITTVKFNK